MEGTIWCTNLALLLYRIGLNRVHTLPYLRTTVQVELLNYYGGPSVLSSVLTSASGVHGTLLSLLFLAQLCLVLGQVTVRARLLVRSDAHSRANR